MRYLLSLLTVLALCAIVSCAEEDFVNPVVPTACQGSFDVDGTFDLAASFSANGVFYLPAKSIVLKSTTGNCTYTVTFPQNYISYKTGDSFAKLVGKSTIGVTYP